MWRRWVALLDRRETGEVLALFRMVVGLYLVVHLSRVWASGVAEIIWFPEGAGGYRELLHQGWLVRLLGGPDPAVVTGLMVTVIVAGAALGSGILGRVGALVTLVAFNQLTSLNGHAAGSYDYLIENALWLLVLADSTATWSVACRLRTGGWSSQRRVPAWPRYLMVFQLVLMYISTGTQKLSAHWMPTGDLSALFYILQQPSFQRFDLPWLGHVYPLTQLMTLSVWVFEMTSPLLLLAFFYRDTRQRGGWLRGWMNRVDYRLLFLLFGMGMHVGIEILMRVGPFNVASLAFFIALLHPDELRAALGRMAARRATSPPLAEPAGS